MDDLLMNQDGARIPRKLVPEMRTMTSPHDSFSTGSSADGFGRPLTRRPTAMKLQENDFVDPIDVLTKLEKGYSNMARIWMDSSKPWSQSDDAFYVLLSVKRISGVHAGLRVVSKIISIGVFAIGTRSSRIFGRVTMASTMMHHKPVLHRVVRTREEAGKYLEAIFRKDEIAFEVKGHIIVQGRCVKRFGKRLR
ncbi:hypothetical protein GQ53DRAFT_826853 [Thozetella sp. PMI_491]|nr:hypothetical protein GQ53DRAFT_826853 [Thozetella sp. PMI_491]